MSDLVRRLRDTATGMKYENTASLDVGAALTWERLFLEAADAIERTDKIKQEYRAGPPDHVQYPDDEAVWLHSLLERLEAGSE